jgi:cellulose synthase/poly-beta-1,6-N-acetylglucosamine synthase-like glycosyltransferase
MEIVFWIFTGCVAVQLLYYLVVFSRLNFVRNVSAPGKFPPVSIIICAKNEAANLAHNLKIVLIQQYPAKFEVVVVNDQSDDNSLEILREFQERNENLKIVNIVKGTPKPLAGKKFALLQGINNASYDTIVVTDADCAPFTVQWLEKLVSGYMHETQIVLGFSPYYKMPGLLNKLIRYETFMTAIQYLGFAKAGMPYMGVGRNLTYKKEIVNKEIFEKNKDLVTGDDDLLVNAFARKKNTEICLDKDAFTYSEPKVTFGAWLRQKKRHLRSGFKYRFIHQLLLFLFSFSGLALYVSFITLLITGINREIAFSILLGFLILRAVTTFRIYPKLDSSDLRLFAPVLDLVYSFYLLIIFFLLLLKPKDSWN